MTADAEPVDEVGWQQRWDDAGLFHADIHGDRPKFYCLEMYP